MSLRGKLWVMVFSGAIAVYAVIGGLPFVGSVLNANAQQTVNDAGAQLRIVENVLQHIQNDYVDVPDMEKVRVGSLRGLANGLDPYSSFLTADQVKEYQATKGAMKTGIGAEFSQVQGFLYVISVVKGGPAEKAGIKSGDFIEYIDSKASRDVSLYDAIRAVSGDPGTSVTLRILRSGEKPQTIKVQRNTFALPKPEARIEAGRVGVVKAYTLETGDSNEIKARIAELQKQGISKLVLDLRGVAGGKLEEAAAVANLFIRDGDLAKVIGRGNSVVRVFTADPSKAVFTGDAAVLINLGTAGAGEAVAAAFLDRKRGEVVGERSFGMGTQQELFPLKSGEGFLLTVAKWASANGTTFLGEDRATMGVKPSVEVKRPDTPEPLDIENVIENEGQPNPSPTPTPTPKPKTALVLEDIQLKRAIELLSGKADAAKAG
ncbi:MAG: PDZ domain-containing protein [Blastocatellia bacterium]|nr:PDZ domain-containing protein [Blastocatellia bacterium]